MTITHHPSLESLMSCSAGSMPEAFAAVMASHLTMCPECRKELGVMEDIGVALFKNLSPVKLKLEVPVMAARRAESDAEPAAPNPGLVMGDVPGPITGFVGNYLDDVPWKPLAGGIKFHILPLSPHAKGDLRLIKAAPGLALPDHGHGGSELTLVLRGAYCDKTGRYETGDVADFGNDIEHQPIADQAEGCVCLIASDDKMRFKSVLARLVQPFTGM